MPEFAKSFVPFVFSILVAVVAYFITEVVKEIRSAPLLVYHISQDGERSSISVKNASNLYIEGAVLQIACSTRECLAPVEGNEFVRRSKGHSLIIAQSSEFAEVQVSLNPRARVEFSIETVSGAEADLLYKANLRDPAALTLLNGRTPVAWIASRYLEVMTWAFIVAAFFSVSLLVWTIWLLACSSRTNINRRETSSENGARGSHELADNLGSNGGRGGSDDTSQNG